MTSYQLAGIVTLNHLSGGGGGISVGNCLVKRLNSASVIRETAGKRVGEVSAKRFCVCWCHYIKVFQALNSY